MDYPERAAIPWRRAPAAAVGLPMAVYMASTLAGCPRGPVPAAPAPPVADVLVEPAQLTLVAGSEAALAAQANDAHGQPIGGASFTFRVADPRVLQVSAQGMVTALGPAGEPTAVTVSSGGRQRQVPVTVVPGPPQRLEKLEGDGQRLAVGEAPADVIAVRVLDGFGNPLVAVPVRVEPAPALFPPAEVDSAADGTARFAVPPLAEPGTVVIVLRAGSADGPMASFQFDVTPPPPPPAEPEPATGAPTSTPPT